MYKILYSKYSTERHRRFMIKTSIIEEGGHRYILKSHMNSESKAWIMGLLDKCEWLSAAYKESGIVPNSCSPAEDGVRFDYIEGITFEEILDECYARQEYDKLLKLIKDYKERIIDSVSEGAFLPNEKFTEIFGQWDYSQEVIATKVSDIDMIFSNIIVDKDEKWNIIDYEWSFDFSVPANFILYRALSDYLFKHNKRDGLWEMDLLRKFGISNEEETLYKKMDEAFHRYVKGDHVTINEINEGIGNSRYNLQALTRQYIPGRVQVFCDFGDGYSEEKSYFVNCPMNEDGNYVLVVEGLEGVTSVRIDPTDTFCVAKIIERECFYIGEAGESHFCNNGFEIDKETYVYNTDDPQWVMLNEDGKLKSLRFVFNISNLDSKMAGILIDNHVRMVGEYDAMVADKNDEIQRRDEEIQRRDEEIQRLGEHIEFCNSEIQRLENDKQIIFNSTSWKITAPLRKIRGK